MQTNVLYYGDNLDILRRYLPDAADGLRGHLALGSMGRGDPDDVAYQGSVSRILRSAARRLKRRLELAGNEGATSPEDCQRIVATATDYIESWIAGDGDRMARSMHPELVKRSLEPDPQTGGCKVETLTRAEMVAETAQGEGAVDAGPYQVSVLDAHETSPPSASCRRRTWTTCISPDAAKPGSSSTLWQPRIGR